MLARIAAHAHGAGANTVARMPHMQILRVAVRDPVEVVFMFSPPQLPNASMIYGEICNFADKPKPAELNADDLIARLIRVFAGQVGFRRTHAPPRRIACQI